jgi:hypothetical protein
MVIRIILWQQSKKIIKFLTFLFVFGVNENKMHKVRKEVSIDEKCDIPFMNNTLWGHWGPQLQK